MHERDDEPRRSASAEAAALRRAEREPDSDERPQRDESDEEPRARKRGGRPSASAEAAALRWRDEHPDD
jgi:hypothetical protein